MGEKSNMLAMEESEKSWKCSRIQMFKNFQLKYYRKMGLKQRTGENSSMLAMAESEKSQKCSRNLMLKNFKAQVLQEIGTKVENGRKV